MGNRDGGETFWKPPKASSCTTLTPAATACARHSLTVFWSDRKWFLLSKQRLLPKVACMVYFEVSMTCSEICAKLF